MDALKRRGFLGWLLAAPVAAWAALSAARWPPGTYGPSVLEQVAANDRLARAMQWSRLKAHDSQHGYHREVVYMRSKDIADIAKHQPEMHAIYERTGRMYGWEVVDTG